MALTNEDVLLIKELLTPIQENMDKGFAEVRVRLDGVDKRLDGIDKQLCEIKEQQIVRTNSILSLENVFSHNFKDIFSKILPALPPDRRLKVLKELGEGYEDQLYALEQEMANQA